MASAAKDLVWLSTDGGPTVVLQATSASSWSGVGDGLGSADDPTTWGDYGRACAVDDYHELVEFGPESEQALALVLGDEPLASVFVAEHRSIVRWWCADSEDHLLAMIEAQLPHTRWQGILDWHVPTGGLVMIDAASVVADYELDGCADDNLVRIDLPSGPCQVVTARLADEDESAVAIVHRFVPQG